MYEYLRYVPKKCRDCLGTLILGVARRFYDVGNSLRRQNERYDTIGEMGAKRLQCLKHPANTLIVLAICREVTAVTVRAVPKHAHKVLKRPIPYCARTPAAPMSPPPVRLGPRPYPLE